MDMAMDMVMDMAHLLKIRNNALLPVCDYRSLKSS